MTILKVDINILSYFDTKLYNSVKTLLDKNYHVFRYYNKGVIKYFAIKEINTQCLLKNLSYKFLNIETNVYETKNLIPNNILEIILEHSNTQIKIMTSEPYFVTGISNDIHPTPAPTGPPSPPSPLNKRVVGYITSWDHYANGIYKWTKTVADMITHVNYAFATISYSQTQDTYYVDMPDPNADSADCQTWPQQNKNCWYGVPTCLEISGGKPCIAPSSTGTPVPNSVNMVPYIGAPTKDNTSCTEGCVNSGGSQSAQRSCNAHLTNGAYSFYGNGFPMVCGMYNHLLNPNNGIRAQYSHIKFIISIGGWYDSNYFSFAVSKKYRTSFINSVVKYVTALGWDGVDFDWEYPGFEHGGQPAPGKTRDGDPDTVNDCSLSTCQESIRSQDSENFAEFLSLLRSAFDEEEKKTKRSEKYIISIAGPAGNDKINKLNLKKMADSLTYVNVMTYDMHGSYDQSTNHQSPIYCLSGGAHGNPSNTCNSVDTAINLYIDGGFSGDQLNLGIPFYAHEYNVVQRGPNTNLPGLYQKHTGPDENICKQNPGQCVPTWKVGGAKWESQGIYYWDEDSKASYAYDNNNFYSFDDYKSIMYKNNYINDMSLGGFMYWFIGGDDSDNTLLNAINKKKSNSKSNIKNASSTPHYLTTLKDIPNISLVNSITAYKYRMTLQSYNYNRRT